jgi:hypothetical protein
MANYVKGPMMDFTGSRARRDCVNEKMQSRVRRLEKNETVVARRTWTRRWDVLIVIGAETEKGTALIVFSTETLHRPFFENIRGLPGRLR